MMTVKSWGAVVLALVGATVACPAFVFGQAIDNTVSFRNINSDHYFRLNYENDFFTKKDRDYSQGIYFEWVSPRLRSFPLTGLLWRPRHGELRYGLALEHNVYTPDHYEYAEIQYGDHPFAGVFLLKTFLIATNFERRERFSTQLSTGIMGPAAGGQGMQEGIHRWLGDITPHGWPHQLHNDVVLNYQVNYEREFYNWREHFSMASFNSVRIGTVSDKLSTGLTFLLGNFYPPYGGGGSGSRAMGVKKKVQYYVYDQLYGNLVGFDATLQGGVFNHSSPYTIKAGAINRLTLQNRYGAVLVFRHLFLEYYQTSQTQEFLPSVFHRTGGIEVGFGF